MRKFRRSHWRQAILIVVVALLAAFRLWSDVQTGDRPRIDRSPGDLAPGVHQVERVVDGDTLLVRLHVRVRLQGVDAPETVKPDYPVEPWGSEASAFTKEFIAAADGQVSIEFDGERRDKFDRSLAFIWVDGRMLNEELLRAGLARAKLGYDYSQAKKDRFRRAQAEAQRAKRGIWSSR